MPRSTFYYWLERLKYSSQEEQLKELIKTIFKENKGRYGYRRITLALRRLGCVINHKKVFRIMRELGLKSIVRPKRKYSSYKGEIGKIAPNILKRNFKADRPNQKWVTDITEFKVGEEKVYLSPIVDLYNGEVISYNISFKPNYAQITDMLQKAFKREKNLEGLILHSDQGWQYQMKKYQATLKEFGIIQSMSRKGNCLDNSCAENFFSLIKSELYYLKKYTNINELIEDIIEYIDWYNNERIKCKLKGMSPVEYRSHSLLVA